MVKCLLTNGSGRPMNHHNSKEHEWGGLTSQVFPQVFSLLSLPSAPRNVGPVECFTVCPDGGSHRSPGPTPHVSEKPRRDPVSSQPFPGPEANPIGIGEKVRTFDQFAFGGSGP